MHVRITPNRGFLFMGSRITFLYKIRSILGRINDLSPKDKRAVLALLLVSNLTFTSLGVAFGYNLSNDNSSSHIENEEQLEESSYAETDDYSYNEYIELKIEEGMTLSKIASDYQTNVDLLCDINNIDNPDFISVGTVIKVPKPQYLYDDYSSAVSWNDLNGQSDKYVKGIDISFAQDNMDLNNVLKLNNIDFVIARSAYFWKYNDTDAERFKNTAITCMNNNVHLGTYFWPTCRSIEETEEQLGVICNMLDELRTNDGVYLTMPVCLDIELKRDGGGDLVDRILKKDEETLKCLKYMIDMLEKEYYTSIYCSEKVANKIGAILQEYGIDVDFWISKYYYANTAVNFNSDDNIIQEHSYNGVSSIRQYAQTGKVNGYDGYVDLDACYKNIPAIIIENELNHTADITYKRTY